MKLVVKMEDNVVTVYNKQNMAQVIKGSIDDFYNDLYIFYLLNKEPLEIEFL